MGRIRELWGRGLVGKVIISLVGLLVVCCVFGLIVGQPVGQQQAGSATAAPSTIEPSATSEPSVTPAPPVIEPTPYPTLTTDQLSAFQTIARYASAMKAAGEHLIGQPTAEDARAASQVLIDGQKAIVAAQLPAWYSPLTERAANITGQCAAVAEAILAVDATALTTEQEATIQRWCITEMGRLQLQAENP